MLILKCILGFNSQSIDFTNAFAQEDIPSWVSFFIEITRDFKSDGGHSDIFLRLNKSLYGRAEAARLWYERLWNGLLEHGFLMRNLGTYMFMSNALICLVCVDDCLFWARSKSDIDNLMKYFKDGGPS